MNNKWFLVQCFNGKELDVKGKIEQKIEAEGMNTQITEVYVPLKDKVNKDGKLVYRKDPVTKEKTIAKAVKFVGYLFVQMDQSSDEAWFLIRNTEGVNGLIGSSGKGTKPTPISDEDIESYKQKELEATVVVEKGIRVRIGDTAKIISGAYEDRVGKITNFDKANNLVTINLETHGRKADVTMSLKDIEILGK